MNHFHEVEKEGTFIRLAELLGRLLLFPLQDEFKQYHLVLFLVLDEVQGATHHVDQKVRERYHVVTPTCFPEAHRVHAAQCHVPKEILPWTLLNMVPLSVQVV